MEEVSPQKANQTSRAMLPNLQLDNKLITALADKSKLLQKNSNEKGMQDQ